MHQTNRPNRATDHRPDEALFADERRRYLRHCAEHGAKAAVLKVKRNELLWISTRLDLNARDGQHVAEGLACYICGLHRQWVGCLKPILRQVHAAGERAFVDFPGHTIKVIDGATGEMRRAETTMPRSTHYVAVRPAGMARITGTATISHITAPGSTLSLIKPPRVGAGKKSALTRGLAPLTVFWRMGCPPRVV